VKAKEIAMNDQNRANDDTRCETTLDVEGMTCMSCVRHVNDALGELDGVDLVNVRLRDGIVVVRHDAAQAPVTALVDALREAGFASQPRRAS
jgi:copper chaperone